MTQSEGSWPFKLTVTIAISGAVIASCGDWTLAQITPDGTLGDERSTITRDVDFKDLSSDQIDGGARRGANLFHSFREFNIEEGRGAYFTNPTGIKNILSRVTGNNPSDIQGTVGVLGKANLFLINSNGIIFGPNASLDVNGSFVGTTANGIELANGDSFSTDLTKSFPSQLLNINPNAFLFNQIATQPIADRSIASSAMLHVPAGQSLLLLGGDVWLDGGVLEAPGGRVELGAVAGTGTVGLSSLASILSLSFSENLGLADVSLTNRAKVNVRGSSSGSIVVTAQNMSFMGDDILEAPDDVRVNYYPPEALPEPVVDISELIAQTCPAGSGPRQSKFVVTGRGGVPPNPGETLNTDAVQVDLVTLNPRLKNGSSRSASTNPTSSSATPIVEAQGWARNTKGNLVLTANAPAVTPHSSWGGKTAKC